MFKQGSNLIFKFSKGFRASKGFISLAKNMPTANFSLMNQVNTKVKVLNFVPKYNFASLPSHQKLTMPALSPTMKKGNIVKWNYKVGDQVNPGDALCDIETDKATLSFEMQETGYLAKILLPEGTKDIDVGKAIAVLVEDKKDLDAFKNYSDSASTSAPKQETSQSSSQQSNQGTEHHNIKGTPRSNVSIRFTHSQGSGSHGASQSGQQQQQQQSTRPAVSLPQHQKLTMPALSPTMKTGKIGKWHKKVGDKVVPDDVLADVETDKATVDFVLQDEGYIAKLLVPEGGSDVPVGQLVAIVVENKEDIQKFENLSVEDILGGGARKQTIETSKPSSQPTQTRGSAPSRSASGDRVFASPLAKKIAEEKGVDLGKVRGSGPEGRVLKHDVEEQAQSILSSQQTQTQQAQPSTEKKGEKKAEPSKFVEGPNPYVDIPVSNMRNVIAQRLLESKTTIPHYYLTSEITMDKLTKIREELNKEAKTKISFNDIFIKAASLACIDVPEVNSQWHGNVIRKFKNADISVAVDTGNGLITPIIHAANTKGLNEISLSIKDLAERAKKGGLKPQEFIGGTFSISNLGMMGVTNFAAVINPPQSCILAIGKTDSKLIQEGTEIKSINVMKVTLSCDHRVVDGAVGAKWLQRFKSYLEKPETMLL